MPARRTTHRIRSPMNRYPAWKYILIGVALAIGPLLHAAELLPRSAGGAGVVVQGTVKIDSALLGTVEDALKGADIAYRGAELDPLGIKVRFADTDTQLKAKDVLQTKLGDNVHRRAQPAVVVAALADRRSARCRCTSASTCAAACTSCCRST